MKTRTVTVTVAQINQADTTGRYTRIALEDATNAELVLASGTAGIDESRSAHLLDAHKTPKVRAQLCAFLRSRGYRSIQVNLKKRITNELALSDFDASKPMERQPEVAQDYSASAESAFAEACESLLKSLGFSGVRFFRRAAKSAVLNVRVTSPFLQNINKRNFRYGSCMIDYAVRDQKTMQPLGKMRVEISGGALPPVVTLFTK